MSGGVNNTKRVIKPILGPGWADIFDMCVNHRTRGADGATVNNDNKKAFPKGNAKIYAHNFIEYLASIYDIANSMRLAVGYGLLEQGVELNSLLDSIDEIKTFSGSEYPDGNAYAFIEMLNDHIENRKQYYSILGTGFPCLVFVDYHEKSNPATKFCVVSLSGHESAVRHGDELQLVSKFFKIMEVLVDVFNYENKHNVENNASPEYHFLDYESKNYSKFIAMLSDNAAEHPDKACAEKKAFSYLLKCNYQGNPVTINGFQAIMLEFKHFTSGLNSGKRKKKIVIYDNPNAADSGYKLQIINMCTQCRFNADTYRSVIEIAAAERDKRKNKQQKKKKVSAKHRRKKKIKNEKESARAEQNKHSVAENKQQLFSRRAEKSTSSKLEDERTIVI